MSGNSLKIEAFSSNTEKLYNSIGIKNSPSDWTDVDAILNLQKKEMESLSPKECAINSILLSQHSVFIQIKSNKVEAFIQWANHKLKKAFDADKTRLFELLDKAYLEKNALSFLARRIELLSDAYKNMSRM